MIKLIKRLFFIPITDNSIVCEDKEICPECGGTGEVINENHYLADSSYEHRFVICKRCNGIGKIDN